MNTPQREARRAAILGALKNGGTRTAAASAAGVSRKTFYAWLNDDGVFEADVAEAEADAALNAVATIQRAAERDWRAAAWLLEHHPRWSEEWRLAPQRVESTGARGGPVRTEGVVVFRPDAAWLEAWRSAQAELPREIAAYESDDA